MSDQPKMLFRTWRDSPAIREALLARSPGDVAVTWCDRCGSMTYRDRGPHCTCEHCGANLDHLIGEDAELVTMADVFDVEADVEERGELDP